jgi:hypothetical protein
MTAVRPWESRLCSWSPDRPPLRRHHPGLSAWAPGSLHSKRTTRTARGRRSTPSKNAPERYCCFTAAADWCPYCKAQLVELEQNRENLARRGYGIA